MANRGMTQTGNSGFTGTAGNTGNTGNSGGSINSNQNYWFSVTSFFDNGAEGPPTLTSASAPEINNAQFNTRGQIIMNAGGSFIMTGATLAVTDPAQQSGPFGPFNLAFDDTGTRMYGVYDSAHVQPVGTTRTFVVTNPDGTPSNAVTKTRHS
jgi:hypothetical protein